MCPAFVSTAANAENSPLEADVQRAIGKLESLHDGDLGVVEVIACGKRAVPALRRILFAREPSGLYETRRRAVEALAGLQADDVLIDFLNSPRAVVDPVEQTGEEAVTNAAARALSNSADPRVIPVLLAFIERPPLAGIVDVLGRHRRVEALPYFIKGLAEDFVRPAAERAIRNLRTLTRETLLETASRRLPPNERETVSSKRQRRSALSLFAELESLEQKEWPIVFRLIHDRDPEISVMACEICLNHMAAPVKITPILRLIDLLPAADWLLAVKIEDCLVKHFEAARVIVQKMLQQCEARSEFSAARARTLDALRRVKTRAVNRASKAGIDPG